MCIDLYSPDPPTTAALIREFGQTTDAFDRDHILALICNVKRDRLIHAAPRNVRTLIPFAPGVA